MCCRPAASTATYAFDALNRITAVTLDGKTTSSAYDAAGNLVRQDLPNTTVHARFYDETSNVTSVHDLRRINNTLQMIDKFDYVYDPAGNVSTRSERLLDRAVVSWTMEYDAQNRLTRECQPSACSQNVTNSSWTYDNAGNRATETRGNLTTSYAYDLDDKLTSQTTAGSPPIVYASNSNGDMTLAGTRTYSYNLAGQVTKTTGTNTGSTADDPTRVTYFYYGDGTRRRATDQIDSNERTFR